MTFWYLVMLFAVGDHWTLAMMPELTGGYQSCMDAGVAMMVDENDKSIELVCIEADDAADLAVILSVNFNFGGQAI